LLVAAVLGGGVAIVVSKLFAPADAQYASFEDRQKSWFSGLTTPSGKANPPVNFTYAARLVRPGVVHIQTRYGAKKGLLNRLKDEYEGGSLEDFFNQQEEGYRNFHDFQEQMPQEASGSGVIISDDGYIVTNNHVVAKATEITVILDDKRRYKAKLIGADPTTDLALLRVEGRNLPFIKYGNSDSLEIGEWVLAIGNPFELTSTVTAGIVSAKARSINILRNGDNLAVESFIQTDAAVNPGNSGGALVNLKGELIGINTAIASTTGTYAGYSFAIPVSLAKKVMDDLLRYGEVQRALLGRFHSGLRLDLA
jgi:S1-C subfamily serine protease